MKHAVMPTRRVGVFMDHSSARLIEPLANSCVVKTVTSGFTHAERQFALSKSEHLMHEKERQENKKYYDELADHLKHFDEVLLFGPGTAKEELYNILRETSAFDAIKIHVKPADHLPENQQEQFVRNYFESTT